jgi:phthalate 4,5-dioxygenase oxygenase subunit
MRAAKALLESGTRPPGAEPAHQRVRSAAVVLPPDVSFADGVAGALAAKAGAAHASI